jgi:polyribonucleotide nucleotidyltransferase
MSATNTNDIKPDEAGYNTDGFQFPKKSKAYRMVIARRKEPTTDAEEAKRVPIDPNMISVLIGAKGRNISLICRYASLYASIEDNSTVVFTRRNDASELNMAHRMMVSMISGGVLRWFSHPAATNKYYHPSVREELQNMVSATSQCTLELLRARNGHLCLLILATPAADLQHVEEQIRALRPAVLEKIKQYAHEPSTHDPTYDASRTLSDG